ncbi:MAG: hypothetical protein Kow0075_03570 [Salibacteraceae bacterium]
MPKDYHSTLQFGSVVQNLARVEDEIDGLLNRGVLTESTYGNVIVAATEATLNAIYHGNQSKPEKLVTVDIRMKGKQLIIRVDDEGSGFNYDELPDPTDPENIEKGHGRGLFIIRNLCDNVEFERNGATVILTFELDVNELIEA